MERASKVNYTQTLAVIDCTGATAARLLLCGYFICRQRAVM